MTPPLPLYDAVLDAGDRLVAALTVGDLGGAAQLLGERRRLIDEIAAAMPPPPSPELAARFTAQDETLRGVLVGQIRSLSDALAVTSRAAAAPVQYATTGLPRGSVIDSAPR